MSETTDTDQIAENSLNSGKRLLTEENKNNDKENLEIKTIEIISDIFNNICEEGNLKLENKSILLRPFMTKSIPSITIKDYLFRLYKYSKINESTVVLILIYIDRMCKNTNFVLTYYNIHKLVLSALISAIKYNEDRYYSMVYYAKFGGVSLNELNNLEYEFLTLIDFNLFVDEQLFNKYNDYLISFQYDDEENEVEEEEDEAEGKNKENVEEKKREENNEVIVVEDKKNGEDFSHENKNENKKESENKIKDN